MQAATDVEKLVARIAHLDRAQVTRHLLNFKGSFPMDFTADYLARLPLDRLRHLLMAAHLHQARCRRHPVHH
ncbi:MAG: hypothetical protein BIFFINMI_00502 [Phycisphaerae bacterium]|nr:hypothetical protein [Phycisphaerae bacterium]